MELGGGFEDIYELMLSKTELNSTDKSKIERMECDFPDFLYNVIVWLLEGQTILHQVADQAADRDPFIRLEIQEAPEKKISMVDARDNELILSGANYGRAKVSSLF